MTMRHLVWVLTLTGLCGSRAEAKPPVRPYLTYVQSFADSLLKYGTDRFGMRTTTLWASVVDTRTGEVPRRGVAGVAGVRSQDRAVGGSNAYQDVQTIRAFRVLSDLTGNDRYRQAADAYLRDVLRHTASPANGLLGWGEHLFYDLYEDRVRVDSVYALRPYGGFHHEFLADTPPWADFWVADSVKTAAAIRGLQYHFNQPNTTDFLFNRHAYWNQSAYQPVAVSQPWIKHSGLYAYSYLFLYRQTGDTLARHQAEGCGALYWNRRNPQTGLTLSCINDKRVIGRASGLSGTALLAYYLLKSNAWAPADWQYQDRALTLLTDAERHAWDEQAQSYRPNMWPDGRALSATEGGKEPMLRAWVSGYGTSNLLEVGRVAAYFARTTGAPAARRMAERCASAARRETPPDTLVAENVGDAIHLSLDLYELTGQPDYLTAADDYAQLAIRHLWRNGWFVRRTGDNYYEAKLGIGTVVSGLLRLHRQQNLPASKAGQFLAYDWSK